MNILECIKRGNGRGYRESKRDCHRGSKGDGFIDIRVLFGGRYYQYNSLITPTGISTVHLTWDDLIADDWVPMPWTAESLLEQIVKQVDCGDRRQGRFADLIDEARAFLREKK